MPPKITLPQSPHQVRFFTFSPSSVLASEAGDLSRKAIRYSLHGDQLTVQFTITHHLFETAKQKLFIAIKDTHITTLIIKSSLNNDRAIAFLTELITQFSIKTLKIRTEELMIPLRNWHAWNTALTQITTLEEIELKNHHIRLLPLLRHNTHIHSITYASPFNQGYSAIIFTIFLRHNRAINKLNFLDNVDLTCFNLLNEALAKNKNIKTLHFSYNQEDASYIEQALLNKLSKNTTITALTLNGIDYNDIVELSEFNLAMQEFLQKNINLQHEKNTNPTWRNTYSELFQGKSNRQLHLYLKNRLHLFHDNETRKQSFVKACTENRETYRTYAMQLMPRSG
jgi:hypothetical protein